MSSITYGRIPINCELILACDIATFVRVQLRCSGILSKIHPAIRLPMVAYLNGRLLCVKI